MSRVKLVLCAVMAVALAHGARGSALWDYVHTPDPTYTWRDTGVLINGTFPCPWQAHVLNMTSQSWMDANFSTAHTWTHQLVVVRPLAALDASYSTAVMYVTGGGNQNPSVPDNTTEVRLCSALAVLEVASRGRLTRAVSTLLAQGVALIALLSCATSTVGATLFQVPNQDIVFADDPEKQPRGEDAAVGFTWWDYINNPKLKDHPEVVLTAPMTKSAVRAMDTVTDFAEQRWQHTVKTFCVAGASKRGWTTWLTASVDKRVIGAVPIVMDMLNFAANVMHMYEAYGGWTFAFEPYWLLNITQDLTTPKIDVLAEQIDVLNYKENLTMPILVVDSTGDEFFMPDDDSFWWGEIPSAYRLMVANAEHSMATGLAPLIEGVVAFYWSILDDTPRPEFTWSIAEGNGTITVTSKTKPANAFLKFATSAVGDGGRRDFRLIKGDTKADPCEFIPVHVFVSAAAAARALLFPPRLAARTA